MKKIYIFLALTLFISNSWAQDFSDMIASGNYTVQEIQEEADAYFAEIGTDRGTGHKQFKRWEYQALRDMDENGRLKSPVFYMDELQRYNAYLNENSQNRNNRVPDVGNWETFGPDSWNASSGWNSGLGRITSIAFEIGNANHIIAGANTGGVWKTTNAGTSWTALTDNMTKLDVYALAMHPTNPLIYYWGSTNGLLFKSIDGGATWTTITSVITGNINKILIDPSNPSKMYATSEAGGGLFKSTDAGATWTAVYFQDSYDVEFKPGDSNIVYATGFFYYRSTDGGATFDYIENAADPFTNGAKMIGVSPANSSVVYIIQTAAFNLGYFGGIFISTDSGANFTKINHTGKNYFGYNSDPTNVGDATTGQAPRDMDIAVNPTNSNEVHMAGINTWRSTDGGVTFNTTSQWSHGGASGENIGYCHADVDLLHFEGSTLYAGTDGGIFKATNPSVAAPVGTNFYTDITNNSGMTIRQYYRFGLSQTDPVVITGGGQDTGSSTRTAAGLWKDWLGGDGMEGFVDKNNSSTLYGTSQFGALYISTDGGESRVDLTRPDNKSGNWVTPFEQDPTDVNTIYSGYDQVYKSTNNGTSWTAISQIFEPGATQPQNKRLDHVKIAPSLNTTMYAAYQDKLFKTTTGSGTWAAVASWPAGNSINSIAIHPTDPNKVAIAHTGTDKVSVTTDGGTTWTSYAYDLPAFSALAVEWDNNANGGLYAGMSYGVYYTDSATPSMWKPFSNNLPNVKISELEVNYADNKLYLGSYGRGLWRTNRFDINTLSISDSHKPLNDISLYPNPATNEVNISWDKTEDVSIRIFNALGKLIYYSQDVSLENTYKIDISKYATGLYFVRINNPDGIITKKLMVK